MILFPDLTGNTQSQRNNQSLVHWLPVLRRTGWVLFCLPLGKQRGLLMVVELDEGKTSKLKKK